MMAKKYLLMTGLALAGALSLASAEDVKVKLTGAEETPPVTTSATASGTITVGADKSVSGSVKSSGMEGTVAHIHTGAPGQAGPPHHHAHQGRERRLVGAGRQQAYR